MSVAIDTATKLHEQQIKAVTRSQDLVVSAVEKVADAVEGLRAKSPSLPESVAGPVEKVTAPVTKIVGTPAESRALFVRSVRDWTEVQHRFQSALLGVVLPAEEEAPVAKVTAMA